MIEQKETQMLHNIKMLSEKTSSKNFYHGQGKRLDSKGRSMVEMLGVLAIAGVLSIGAVAGYRYGINKYHANTIIHDVTLRAIDVITQISRGITPSLAEWDTINSAGYTISLVNQYAPQEYFIRVENVPYRVCEMILDTMPEDVEIWVNNAYVNASTICNENNIMEFAYDSFKSDSESSELTTDDKETNTTEVTDTSEETTFEETTSGPACNEYNRCDSNQICAEFCEIDAGLWNNRYSCASFSRSSGYTSPYGGTWYQIFADNNAFPEYWTGEEICAKYGLSLPAASKLVSYTGSSQIGYFELSDLGKDLAAHFNVAGIFTATETSASQIIVILNPNSDIYGASVAGGAHDDYRRCNTVYQGAFLCYDGFIGVEETESESTEEMTTSPDIIYTTTSHRW